MPRTSTRWRTAAIVLAWLCLAAVPDLVIAAPPHPEVPREFRAAWVATVNNIDWPSRPELDLATQQQEARAILDLAVQTGLNAVVFQVRTAADALYQSPIEPWSVCLTGRQGTDPGYDPLQFWVDEAHARGLLLHAWLNPFRARLSGAKYEEAPGHIARTRPDLVRRYGDALWLDPGEPEARALTLQVVGDIARRYDVDGIHVDDYFYPYPIKDPDHPAHELPFPDDLSWSKAKESGVTVSRGDWRRDNINSLIAAMAFRIRAERPRALFGISPFGIVRPGRPAGVVGFDQYDKLAADAVLWLEQGWCDYLAPQLYWKIDAPGQPFRPLLNYWASVNPKGRHLWPGLAISRVGDGPQGYEPVEILHQIAILREQPSSPGAILFSFKALQANKRGIGDQLRSGPYATAAVVPPTPWLGVTPPPAPESIAVDLARSEVTIATGTAPTPFLWAVHRQVGETWAFSTQPGEVRRLPLAGPNQPTEAVVVRSVDRLGNVSEPIVWNRSPSNP